VVLTHTMGGVRGHQKVCATPTRVALVSSTRPCWHAAIVSDLLPDVWSELGGEPDELRPYFSDVRRLTGDSETNIWLCTGRTEPWATLWPRLRSLTVG
jgi:hypothetical protein